MVNFKRCASYLVYCMKLLKKTNLYCILILAGYLLLNTAIAAQGFITSEQTHGIDGRFNLLIRKIDKPRWTIGYRYGAECLPEDRQNGKKLEETITAVLRAWLQPLREMQPARPITDDFRYVLQPDFNGDWFGDHGGLLAVDTRITFECRQGISLVLRSQVAPPEVYMRVGTEITPLLVATLTHELGHAFGLDDTYIRDGFVSTGGLEITAGTQPGSRMNGRGWEHLIAEDDVRGILWLYKRFHEDLDLEDCFFPDYVFEESPRGCIPKHHL